MKELLSIRQTSDLQDYYDHFYQSMHRLLVHNDKHDGIFFITRFIIDALKPDIRSTIQLHKLRTIHAAMSLDLLRVEVLEASNRRFYNKTSEDFNKYSA